MSKWVSIFLCVAVASTGLVGCGDDTTEGTDAGPGTDSAMDAGTEQTVSADITTDTTWTSDRTYILTDKIFVTDGAELTIEAGTTILGETGAALIVTRGASIDAAGTGASPIVFSSAAPEGTRATGDWAGVALLGDATVNNGTCVNDGNGETIECDAPGFLEGFVEGIEVADTRGRFGGTADAGSCGSMRYVRIEFAGAELSPDNELNGLTIAGCGSGTTLQFIQVHRGKDDGVEFFGGTAAMDHVVISGASDDSLDWDLGWRGSVQFLVVHQFPGVGDYGFEADNLGSNEQAVPRSNPTLFNVTMIGTSTTTGMLLREGTRGTLRNFVIADFGVEPLDLATLTANAFDTEWPSELSIENSFFFNNGTFAVEDQPRGSDDDENDGTIDDDSGFSESAAVMDSARNNTMGTDPMIGDTSVTAPDYVPTNAALAGQATPTIGDTTATYAGAFEPNGTDWSAGWTAYPSN